MSLGVDTERLAGLDGLRALAVIGVLAFHDGRLSGGFLGVDLFFAISGFLITTLLLRELTATDGVDMIGFWGRRLRRLLPAVSVLLAVVVVAFRLVGDPGEWIIARRDAPWAQFYAANWHQIGGGRGYWDAFAAPSAFEHLWSLAIEEQFYLFWPIAMVLLWRFGRTRAVAAGAAIGTVASALTMTILFTGGDPTRVYMGTDTRAFSLLAGALVATPVVRDRVVDVVRRLRRGASIVTMVLVAVLAWAWIVVDGSQRWLFEGGLAVHSLIAAVLAVAVAHSDGPLTRVLSWSILEWIGRLSYSLYLWHWPVFIYCSPRRFDLPGWQITIIRLAVTVLLSMASYFLVEVTMRSRVRWVHGGRGRIAFLASTAVLVVVWAIVRIPGSTNSVDAAAIANAVSVPSSTSTPDTTANTTVNTTPDTSTTPPEETVTSVHYFGDSVAYDMWPAVRTALEAAGLRASTGAFGGVGLVGEGTYDPIADLATTIDTEAPDLLIVQLSVWDAQRDSDTQVAALDELLSLASDRDQRVLLLSFPTFAPDRTEPGQSVLEENARRMATRSSGLVRYIDQTPALGIEFAYDIDGDGVPERKRDGIHVCPTGALRSAQWLLEQLESSYGVPTPVADFWADGSWSTDERYDSPPGACARL
ncbi:MAG: acyltransferase family protein [Actinomycetota bacterium]